VDARVDFPGVRVVVKAPLSTKWTAERLEVAEVAEPCDPRSDDDQHVGGRARCDTEGVGIRGGTTTRSPEMAVVEGEDGEPGVVESLRERIGAQLLRHRAAAGHDHAGAVGSGVVPSSALRVAADEADFLPLDGHLEAASLDDGGHTVAGRSWEVVGWRSTTI